MYEKNIYIYIHVSKGGIVGRIIECISTRSPHDDDDDDDDEEEEEDEEEIHERLPAMGPELDLPDDLCVGLDSLAIMTYNYNHTCTIYYSIYIGV